MISRLLPLLLVTWLVTLASASLGQAETDARVALIIANSNYEFVGELKNTRKDADDIGAELTSLGYEVIRKDDLSYQDFRRTLRDFRVKSAGADVSIIYYAGHGMEIDKVNYLIPVDAVLDSEVEIEFEAIPLDLLTLAGSGAKRFRLMILDACRNNPFLKKMSRTVASRSIRSGLASIEPDTSDTLVAYAAREGTVAFDGSGENSPFATALLTYMAEPGLEIGTMFRKVRDKVLEDTGRQQEPFVYGSLSSRSFYLNPPVEPEKPVAPIAATTVPERDDCRFADIHWQSALAINKTEFYQEHLRLFPTCPFATLARFKISELTIAAIDPASAPPGPTPGSAKADQQSDVAMADPAEPTITRTLPAGADPDIPATTSGRNDRATCLAAAAVGVGRMLDFVPTAEEFCLRAIAADRADARLPHLLARAYLSDGQAVAAVKWLEEAVSNGSTVALNDLGVVKASAGVGYDPAEARQLFKAAAEFGIAPAYYNLAVALDEGLGGPVDEFAAAEWYTKAAEGGDAVSMTRLGNLYLAGRGVPKDPGRALALYRQAARLGDADAMNNVGWMQITGSGVPVDVASARILFEKAAEVKSASALYNLGWLSAFVEGANDYPQAARLFIEAWRAGSVDASRKLLVGATRIRKDLWRSIQAELKTAGTYSGTVDGVYGPQTRRAIESTVSQASAL